jgi:hypothetical protein
MGQTFSHFPHNVHIQGQRDSTTASSRPRDNIRISFRGSKPSIPDAGHELEHIPQVTQKSWENVQDLNRL